MNPFPAVYSPAAPMRSSFSSHTYRQWKNHVNNNGCLESTSVRSRPMFIQNLSNSAASAAWLTPNNPTQLLSLMNPMNPPSQSILLLQSIHPFFLYL